MSKLRELRLRWRYRVVRVLANVALLGLSPKHRKSVISARGGYPVGQWSRWYQANKKHQKLRRQGVARQPENLRREWVR